MQSHMQDIRALLANALASVNAYDAELVRRPSTRIEDYPSPFLKRSRILRVEPVNPHKPIPFYVGLDPEHRAYMLTGSPGAYVMLARADGVSIDSEDVAIQYVTTYFEVTRSMSELLYVIASVDDVRFRPGLTGANAAARDAFLEKYRDLIHPPAAARGGRDYVVTVYRVRQQSLERHDVHVTAAGDLDDVTTVLERGLPLVYGA